MNARPAIADADARARALDPARSSICSAPAGSGKTELLTQRFLTLLARVGQSKAGQPENIVAITFTRKAVAEMRSRILGAIKQAATQPRPHAQHQRLTWDLARQVLSVDKARQWSLLETPSRLQIKTFDSLCAALANSLSSTTTFAALPSIADNPEELYLNASRALLQSLEARQPWSAAIGKLLQLMDNNVHKLERLLAALLARREAWLPIIGSGKGDKSIIMQLLEQNLQRVRDDAIAKLIAAIPRRHQLTLMELASVAAANMLCVQRDSAIVNCLNLDSKAHLPGADESGIRQWLGLVELLLKKDNHWRKKLDRRVGFPVGDDNRQRALCRQQKQQGLQLIADLSRQPGLLPLLLDVRHLPSAGYDEDQASLLCALLEVLPVLTGYLQIGFQEVNRVDFAEVSIRARSALGAMESPTELALALDHKIQHLLVDEFQDVSSTQFELLTLLTAGWQVGDGRSLFFVGDPMQSIYGFRHANVGLFLQCSEQGIGDIPLETLHLNSNFRSQAAIVACINRVFSQSFPVQNDIAAGAVSYLPSQPILPSLPGRAVWFHGFVEDTGDEPEAQRVLAIVRQSRLDNPQQTVAILVRNRRHAIPIMALLAAAALPYRAVDLDPLADNSVIQDLMSLTRALLHPADDIAWLSLLRAPWCGLSLADLEVIANVHCRHPSLPPTLWQRLMACTASPPPPTDTDTDTQIAARRDRSLSVDGRMRLQRVLPILALCITRAQRQPLRQCIEGAWIALGGPACIEHNRDFNNAERYFSLLESLELPALIKNRHALQTAVQTLYAAPDPDADDKLQIMTIHKAKGLEFDTVIIPSLERSARHPEPELLCWDEYLSTDGTPLLLMSPITCSGREKDPIYHYLTLRDKRRRLNENARLLYVGCTRARRRLHLLARVKIDNKIDAEDAVSDIMAFQQPSPSSLLSPVWSALKSHIQCEHMPAADTSQDTAQDSADNPPPLRRLSRRWQMPTLKQESLLADYIPYHQYHNAPRQGSRWRDPTPRYVGILVHRILQRCLASELMACQWRQYHLHWSIQLQALGVPNSCLAQATEKVIATLEAISTDRSVHWLFATTYPQRKTEYPVTLASRKGAEQCIIDLLIFDGESTWIVDYKTSRPRGQQHKDQFIEQELTAYRDIMYRYHQAIACMGYKNIRLALYFPMIGCFAEYDQT